MFKLEKEKYHKLLPLIKSQNELSVYSVIAGITPGEIFVNSISNPTAALIQTSECNLIAGRTDDNEFNSSIKDELDFWDQISPDTKEWGALIPAIHQNKFIRSHVRRHYILSEEKFNNLSPALPEGYSMEEVIPVKLREANYDNTGKLLDWIGGWGDDENFCKYGVGSYIRKDNSILSWSLSDCSYKDKIAIGIHTDEHYRKRGLGAIVAAETIRKCFNRGYKQVEWLCVDINKGSIAIAEKLGFTLSNKYDSFTSYPPIENQTDLSEDEWLDWAKYYEGVINREDRLMMECLFAYIKANKPDKAYDILQVIYKNGQTVNYNIDGFINYLHNIGMADQFDKDWFKKSEFENNTLF